MKLFMTAVAAMLAVAAHAQPTPYVGLDVTQIRADYTANGGSVLPKDHLGVNPRVGLEFNDYVAVEAGYLRTQEESKNSAFGTAKTRVSGLHADVIGRLPVVEGGRLGILGTAGIGRYEAKGSLAGASTKVQDTTWQVGGGLDYRLTDSVSARALVRYIPVDFQGATDKLMQASVGMSYRF